MNPIKSSDSGIPMDTNNDIESHLLKINDIMRRVCDTAQKLIDILPDGTKISPKKLVEKVSQLTDLPQSQVAPIVGMFVKNYDGCTIQKGRLGGIYRGEIPKRSEHLTCTHCGQRIKPKKTSPGHINLKKTDGSGSPPNGEQAA